MNRFQILLATLLVDALVGAWNSVLMTEIYQAVVCADARTLVNVVPQLLLCDSMLSCPALGIAVTLACGKCGSTTNRPDCFRCGRTPCSIS